ncbi:dynein axonemal intermediate chain 4 isoform 1-T1 [Odontesthes bonariensis]|uniref:dynein axonemal intermediate chain 4-like n=1 Tax=Odontesthes bonariensis TaxID=219752 RepID=UPI003F58D908
MSTSLANEDKKGRRALVLRPSSRVVNVSVNQSSKCTYSVHGSSSRRRFSLCGGSKVLDKSAIRTPRPAVQVFDEEGNDVTPLQLDHSDPGAAHASRFFLDEISAGSTSGHTMATGSFIMPFSRSVLGSSRISSQSTIESVNEGIEDTFSRQHMPISFRVTLPDVKQKIYTVKEQATEDMLKEIVEIFITETGTILLLDISPTFVPVEADNAEAIIERNNQYAELCRTTAGNDNYVDRSMQTINGATKSKQVQTYSTVMVEAATTVSSFDIQEDPEQEETTNSPETAKTDYAEASLDTNRSAERSLSVGSTSTSVSALSSLKEVEAFGNSTELDLQFIMLSEKFQHSLLVMERSVLLNIFQPQLAAYRQLPLLKDLERPENPKEVEQKDGDNEICQSPALDCLWTFNCELTRGCSISSMGWNKKNPDLLAVGYGEFDCRNQKTGLVCCWSIKNPMWPEHIIHCDSAVTSLDFSASSPSQLAVGMYDGSIAIYDVQSPNKLCVIDSRECPKRHLGPVWQLRWNQQDLSLTGEERVEALFSVGADGRISKWFVFHGGLDCIDLMKFDNISNTKGRAGGNKTEEKAKSVPSALTPGLCFDFHPTDSSLYLTGTWDGLIHKCSCSNSQQFLETYKSHLSAVNCIIWCPFHPDVFLSCSADWTIQLWRQDHLNPILGFTSTQRAVGDIKWSPKWATVFGAVNERHLEIWDLNLSLLDPVIMQPAAPGVRMTSLLFALETDCVVVGDSDGQVTVYQIKNLGVGQSSQMDVLDDILFSAASR